MEATATKTPTSSYAHRDGTTCHDVECPRLDRCDHGVPRQWLPRGEFNCTKCRLEAGRKLSRKLSAPTPSARRRRTKGSY